MIEKKFHFIEQSPYFTGKADKLSSLTDFLIYKLEEKKEDNTYIFCYIHIPLKAELPYKWEVKIGEYREEGWRLIHEHITTLEKAPSWFLPLHVQAQELTEKMYRLRNIFSKNSE